ncbi:helix-turn-helix domain-containing protein [Mesorhizobium sp. LMG 17147]|uniref:helix-turn-helix transcriptional regulator n=1 Tax=Mesorhizobium sp. LMG 17147 TaxID=2963091 RepID=UPI0020C9EA34|nr:helix-turn-helix domain-containing protein [Mesorhizobium sp. LMG 17147]MCP9229999.1 helix-turn-helix domain-containing protein [Mesorhizobium sp. LMG 17147]
MHKKIDELLGGYRIPEVCQTVGITTPTYYKLRAQGLGPREMRFGAAVRISAEALRDWIREREDSTGEEAMKMREIMKERSIRATSAMK